MPFNINNNYPKPSILNNSVIPSQFMTVGIVPVPFPTPFNGSTDLVTFDVQLANVRVRWDGPAPTASLGHLLYLNTGYTFSKATASRMQFIRDAGASVDGVIFASEMEV